ncbi:hypothetical protein, partial [Vreelandella sp. V005]|uniref:hypothetical protein n=1 Tax=Vreelandella sp. V005 TaxID=3459608 RepID=UPI004044B534
MADHGVIFVKGIHRGDVDRRAIVLGVVRRGVAVSGRERRRAAVSGGEADRGQRGAGVNGVDTGLGQGHVLAVKG